MIYLSSGILSMFVLFAVIPLLVSLLGVHSYVECLKAGWVLFAAVAVFLIFGPVWNLCFQKCHQR